MAKPMKTYGFRTEKAHSSFIGKKFTVGKHHVVVEVEPIFICDVN